MAELGIRIEHLRKRYGEGDTAVDALKDVNMTVAPGEVVGLIGPSGSGKSTLLKCLGAVIEPSGGKMVLGGETIYDGGWKIPDLRALRRDSIGFVFQAPYLIPFLDVTDNVALLPMLAGRPNAEARERARELLAALDVGHRAQAQPSELSGGEQQRVSIARALANRPPVILADEPTAPLDSERALAVVRILNQMAQQYHTAIIVVTHDEKIIPTFKRLYPIRDGSTHAGAPATDAASSGLGRPVPETRSAFVRPSRGQKCHRLDCASATTSPAHLEYPSNSVCQFATERNMMNLRMMVLAAVHRGIDQRGTSAARA